MNTSLKLFLTCLLCFYVFNIKAQDAITTYQLKPTPSWVKKYPDPKLQEPYLTKIPFIQIEKQYNHNLGENYKRFFIYIKDQTTLNDLGRFSESFEPDYQTIRIHTVTIHRDQKEISYGDQLHVEYIQEGKQINGTHYDIDGKVMIFFDNKLQIGDVVEIAYSSKGWQPDLHGTLFYDQVLTRKNLKGNYYFRILGKKNKPFQYKLLNIEEKPTVRTLNGIMSLEFMYQAKKEKEFELAPHWNRLEPRIHITDLTSWKEFLQLNERNFLLDKVPAPNVIEKVNSIVDRNDEKAVQINSILNFIQKEIAYLEYDKIRPKQPEIVIKQGFGDCKSKSLLAVKMLETIGVESWPMIVDLNGYDDRLLNIPESAFDHCVLEFIYEQDTIVFDTTRNLQRGDIYKKYHSDFRYGFRVKEGTKQLHKITQNYLNNSTVETILHTRQGDVFFNNYETTKVTYEGENANRHIATYNEFGISSLSQYINDDILRNLWINDSLVSFTYEEKVPKATIAIKEFDTRTDFFNKDYEQGRNDFTPQYLFKILSFAEAKSKGPKMSLPRFNKNTQIYKIVHPEIYKIAADSIQYSKDWITFSKKLIPKKDTLIAVYTTEILKKEINSDRFEEIHKDIDSIQALSSIEIDDPQLAIYARQREMSYYVIPIIFLLIIILIIFCIVKFIKRGKKIKKQKTEITFLKNELQKYKTD